MESVWPGLRANRANSRVGALEANRTEGHLPLEARPPAAAPAESESASASPGLPAHQPHHERVQTPAEQKVLLANILPPVCFKGSSLKRQKEKKTPKNSALKGRKQVHPQTIYVKKLPCMVTHQPPSKRAWDGTPRLWPPLPCLWGGGKQTQKQRKKTNSPQMHFFLGHVESRLSCAIPEAQEDLHTQGGGGVLDGQSPRPALWRGLRKPWLGQEGAGKGLLPRRCRFPALWPGAGHSTRGVGGPQLQVLDLSTGDG